MLRTLTTLATSAALALTSLPAQADPMIAPKSSLVHKAEVDAGEVAAGLIALGVIAAVIDGAKDKHHQSPPPVPYKVDKITRAYPIHPHHGGHGHSHGGAKRLPSQCLRDVSKPGHSLVLYGQNCLNRSRVEVSHLPQACAVKVHTRQGLYTGYAPSCLQARGYRVALR